ncbi:YadA-like family protein [Gallibacterium anatis]|uniref:YadA-like family protein n=1 Tax=Gallibacterium anatis TaxID=750 RepID=UPI003006823B
MNKIYKVIFNRNKNRYEIVSELASSRGGKCKVKTGKQIAKLFMTGLLATFLSSVALAADQEVKVKYDETTGTIKIVKTDPNTSDETILASYAVGGNISPITSIGTKNPTGIIAMGDQSKAVQSNTIAIGADAHAGNVGGSDDTNGRIAIGTKTVASGNRSIALGNQSATNNGSYNIAQGNDAISIGTSTSVFGYSGVSIGRRNIIGIPDPTLVSDDGVLTTKSNTPYREADPGGNSVIVGAYNVAYGNRSSIIGTYSRAMGSNSVAIGSGVQSLSDGSIAIGKGSGYEFEDGSRKVGRREKEFYGRDWELPPEYKVLKQVLSTDIAGDEQYKGKTGFRWEKDGTLPKYNNYGAGSSDPGGFIVEGKNALGIGTYTQVRGDSAIGLATGEMTADLSDKDKSAYARDMRKIMDMEETLYDAKEALQAGTGDTAALESAVQAAEKSLAAAKKEFRKNYLSKYSFVEGEGALGVGRQILAQGDRSMAVGDYAKAISSDAIAYGGKTLANGTNSMAMGGNAHVGTEATETTEAKAFDNSMAIGSHTNVQAGNAVALGAFSQVTGTNSLALGFGTQSSTDSNNITYNSVSGHDSTLIGSYGTIQGNNSILIGSSGNIANDRVVGLGNNINIAAADSDDQENNTAGSVFLGDHAGYVKDSKRARSLGKVTLVGSKEEKELTESLSSTKGALRDYTEDFIYIYMLERQDDGTQIGAPIAVRSDFAGGDSTVGVVSVGSTYEQTFENLDKIKEHHKKVGSLITVPVEVTVQVTKNGISLGEQKQIRYFAADSTEEAINADNTLSEADKKKVWDAIQAKTSSSDSTYTVFETRRIQNVAPGLIGVNSTDAINGSQLFATNQMLGNLVGSLKKTFGDNVTITEDGQIKVSGGTLGWIAKAKAADGSNGTVNYQVGKDDKITKDDLEKKGSAIEAADQLVFQAGKNIGLVQTPDTLTISTIDTPSFKSVELRGDEKTVDGKKVTEVTKIDSSGMKVVTETSTPASDGGTTVTEKVSTTVGKDGVSTDGSVKVTNGTTDLVTIDKGTDGSGTDQEYGKIGLDGKNGSNATITVDRGTSSLDDTKNIGTDPNQDISKDNPAKMDRITYTTKNKDGNDVITHEVATMDDGLFFQGDVSSATGTNNTFSRKLSEKVSIVGEVKDGLEKEDATAEEKAEAIRAKLSDGNIGVISDGTDTLTVKLAKQLTGLDSTTYTSPTTKTDDGDATSTMKVDGNGVRFVGDNNAVKTDAPSLTTDGITGGNKTITDVASGIGGEVKDPDKNNANTFLENVNKIGKKDGDQPAADAISENVVVNAKDLKNLVDTGFKLNTSGQGTAGASTVKIGDTINVANGVNTKVSAIDDTVKGTYTFHIDVTGMPISYTDNQGNALTKIGDKYYKNTDIKNGKPKTNAKEVPADEVTNNIKVINKDGTTKNQGTISNVKSVFDSNIGNGADTGSKVDEIKDGSVISNTGSNQFINDLTKLNDQVDPKATDAEAEKIRAKKDEEKLNSVSTVRDLQKVALTPLFFEGDVAQDEKTANTFDRKLSEKTKIVGGQKDVNQLTDDNIGVVSNGTDTLTIKLAKNLVNLTSVETGSGNNKTKMTENGITTTVKDGDTFKVTTTTPNGLATTEVKLDSEGMPTGESKTTTVTTDGVTITTQTPKNGDKPASTTETKLSKDGLATDGTVKVTNGKTGDDAKDLVTIGKGTETDPNATDKEFGTVAIDGKNGSNATLTVDRGTKSVTDKANILKNPKQPAGDNNPVSMDRLTYTTTGADGKSIIKHEVATLDDGFFLTTEHTEEDKTRTVLFNHTIKVLDGANTKVSAMGGEDGTHTFSIDVTGLPMTYTATDANGKTQDVHKVGDTYTLADGTKLVQVRDKFYKPDQVEEVNGTPQVKADQEDKDTKLNNISLTSPVANTAPTLSNVGSALKKSDGTRITMSDLDDSSVYPTNNPIWNNAVNVGDLKAATDAARTEVTGTGKAIVTKKTGDQGQNIYNVHVDPIVDVVGADGSKVVRGDDGKYYNPTDIANKTYIPNADGNGGNWYDNGDLTNGVPNQGAKPQNVTPTDVKNNFVNPNGTDSIVLDNVKSGIGGEVKDAAGKNTFIDNINKVGKKNPDGTVAPDAISENTVVNAKDLKNVVDTGFKLNTSGHSGNAQTVKIGETIKVVDGANTKVSDITPKDGVHEFHIDVTGLPMTYTVSQTGGTDAPVSVSKVGDTYQLADGTKLVKVGDKFYKPSQLVDPKAEQPQVKPEEENKDWTVNDSISLVNKEGSNNAPTLKNVGSGLKDANGNSTTLDQAVGSNAVNVDDLRTLGKAATTEVTGTGAAEVTKVTGADGQNIYNVHVERFMQVAETDVEGNKVVKAADNHYYKEADIKDKTYIDGQWYNNTDIKDKTKIGDKWYNADDVVNGVPKPNATESTVQATAPNKAVGLQNNLVNPNDNTPTRLSNLASALSGEVGNGANPADNSAINGIDKNGKPTSESGSNTFVKNVLDLDATEKTVEQLKTSLGHEPSEDEVKAEKARAEKDKALLNSAVTVADLQKTLQSPLFFEGDSADGVANENDSDKNTFARKLSQKTKIVGGVDLGLKENATAEDRKKAIAEKLSDNNIGVVSNGTDTLTIKLAKNLVNLTSVETGSGDNKTKMTENGITTTVKDGDTFKVTTTTPNGLATTEVKLDSEGMPTGESKTTTVTTDGVTITTQTPKNGDKPASTTETKLSKDGLATDGTVKVTNGKTGDDAKDLVTIGKGTETDPNATDKEFGTVAIDGKNGSNATLTVDRGTKSVTDKANILKNPKQPAGDNNPVSMDRLTYTTTGADGKSIIKHEVATLDDGFFLTTEHTEEDKTRTVLFNHTIKVLDGANTKVSAMGGEDGTHTFSIDVTGLPVTYTATKTDANGTPTGEPVDVSKVGDGYQLADGTKLEKAGDKYYTPDQLENGQPKPDAEGLTIKQSVSLVQDNGAPATLERVGSGRRNGMNAKDTPMDWNSILNAAADNAEVNNMLTNAANIGDVRDAIKSITDGTSDNASGGFGLTGNNGDVKQDLGKTITVKGGIANKVDEAGQDLHVPEKSTTDKNTYVNVKNNEMVVEIAKDLIDLDSVTVGSVDPTTGKGETTKITGKDVTIKDKAGNANTSTATKDELTNANGDKTTVEAGKVDVSKKNADGTTSNTNIDGSKITLENKDKDSNTVGSKTDIGTDGIRITYKDDKGKTDPKKDVSLTDKGLNNGGNQIKNVGSGLVNKDGNKINNIAGIKDQDILSNGVNVGDLKQAINSVTNSSNGGGFGLTGNNGKIMQDLGKTITIKGGIDNKMDDSGKKLPAKSTTAQNTYVNVKDSEMIVEIAKDLTDLDSVTIGNVDEKGNGGTVINKDSMTVKDKDGKNSTNIGTGTIGTSKTDGNGNTSSTNIDGSTITLENKDKDGKTVGSKTDIGTDGIKITYKDDKGNVDPKKDVSLTDKGLNNGGNQIKNVGSGLVDKNGKDITDISNIADSDILSNGVNVKDLQSVNKKLKDDIINISNQVDDIKNSAPVVYTDENGKRVSKQGDKFVNEDGIEVKPHKIKLSLVNADGKTTNPSTLQNVAKGVNKTDAVNVEQLKEATEKPLTFNGDAGSSSAKLGETVAIKGGANSADLTDNNIGVIANSTTKTLNVKLSKKLKGLESAEFVDNNGNTTNITGDGVHISGGNGSNVSLTSQGLNNGGNRITNVAPGVEATDAVNVSQLNQVGAALHNRINNVAKGAYGGVASAGAMASLPQAYLPGKSMVAAGASHYRGESAVALGASRISDNGKIILKLNASHNTSGNTMVGAGVGYQF